MRRLKRLAAAWSGDRCSRKAAALAYYTVFSLAPLLVIVVAVASLFVSDSVITAALTGQIQFMLGPNAAALIAQILQNARSEQTAGIAAVLAFVVLVIGATSAFGELKESLDDLWGVGPDRPTGVWSVVRSRLLSFGIVLALAFLLLVSLVINAALEMFSTYFGERLGASGTIALHTASVAGSFIVIALLFAVIYKVLPEVRLSWGDVAVSALLTASLFMVGRLAIAKFLGHSAAASVFGTASSLAVLLLWVYYSTLIFFLGAEITKVWKEPSVVRRKERRVRPVPVSVSLPGERLGASP